jgi:hypothetical protein
MDTANTTPETTDQYDALFAELMQCVDKILQIL